MARFSRVQFEQAHDYFTQRAMDNFCRDGHVQPVLAVFRKDGSYSLLMGVAASLLDDPETERARSEGFGVLPYPFRDHMAELKAALAASEAVACILIAEAWTATGELAKAVLLDPTIPTSERTGRGEAITVVGVWPREMYSRTKQVPITRTEGGVGVLGEPTDLTTLFRSNRSEVEHTEWLSDLLPQRYGQGRR